MSIDYKNYNCVCQDCARQPNDQAHPPPEAEATGGTTRAQAVGGRVQRLVRRLLVHVSSCLILSMPGEITVKELGISVSCCANVAETMRDLVIDDKP